MIYSPLADVLIHEEEVLASVARDSVRFDRLLRIGTFQGFLGIPVTTDEMTSYGLFLFKRQGGFRPSDVEAACLAALAIARVFAGRSSLTDTRGVAGHKPGCR